MGKVIESEMDVPSIAMGFSLGFFVLTSMKAARQTVAIYKRTQRVWNPYSWMIWAELVDNLVMTIYTWCYLRGNIKPSFGFFFGLICMWVIQTQLILQIIANRVGLVMVDKQKATRLKWALFILIGIVNVSVFCIWIPARMKVSETFIHINNVWDRAEKIIFLFIDLALNGYFLWLVRSKLIQRGLTKYKPLFNFNASIIVASLAMDVLIVGMMSLPNTFIYVQFHPLAYLVKLNIELSMADLISKVVRGSDRTDAFHSDSRSGGTTELTSHGKSKHRSEHPLGNPTTSHAFASKGNKRDDDSISLEEQTGIIKTVATTIVTEGAHDREGDKDDGRSTSSSTAELHHYAR
ncbi:hypothetical protein BU16DRAFT_542174 [Lophium mytilinum]|uniref:Uncharacterized protein n=1 Tax=Lophium mytilinum TaxID=390894 RepID=A0A6A6QIK4_9PEZI|nr:hypothetical protein BU16DRAFT_542174 [Lophium mytilinum]